VWRARTGETGAYDQPTGPARVNRADIARPRARPPPEVVWFTDLPAPNVIFE
jgi:hypothetical protein